jgi:hypothetical protein
VKGAAVIYTRNAAGRQTGVRTVLRDVRFRGQSGKHVLALSFSGLDPIETLAWHTGGRLTASGYANLSVLREGARVAGVPLLPAGIPIEFGCKNDPQEAR